MYNVAFFFHILGAMMFVSGVTVAGVAFETARRRHRPVEIAALLSLSRIGVLLVAVGVVLTGGFGLWLVHGGRWGYGSAWVDISIGLFIVTLVLGALGGRRPKEARLLATQLARNGADEVGGDLRALLEDRTSRMQNYVSLVLVLTIIALMCFKP